MKANARALGAVIKDYQRRLRTRSAIRRLAKYGVVGGSGVGINLAVFTLLSSVAHLHYLIAAPTAIEIALCSNYLLHNNWTFADRRKGWVSIAGLARYHVVSVGGTLINLAILHVLAGSYGVPPFLANLAGIAVATGWNFMLSAGWAWRSPRTQTAGRAMLFSSIGEMSTSG